MAGKNLVKELVEEVKKWGYMKQTGVSLRQMMNFGGHFSSRNLLISAPFVHKEFPIRIARRVLELEDLPYGLSSKLGVVKRFVDSDNVAPPIRIIVADGLEDVTIKICDEGGGIPRSGLPKLFTYLYSTTKNPLDEDFTTTDVTVQCTMAGYGHGIPLSRLCARYFGGDLQIILMEGCGTDAYLHLSRLGDKEEPLP